jgi:hypothetical protein
MMLLGALLDLGGPGVVAGARKRFAQSSTRGPHRLDRPADEIVNVFDGDQYRQRECRRQIEWCTVAAD